MDYFSLTDNRFYAPASPKKTVLDNKVGFSVYNVDSYPASPRAVVERANVQNGMSRGSSKGAAITFPFLGF